jgi:hypothetical protein
VVRKQQNLLVKFPRPSLGKIGLLVEDIDARKLCSGICGYERYTADSHKSLDFDKNDDFNWKTT